MRLTRKTTAALLLCASLSSLSLWAVAPAGAAPSPNKIRARGAHAILDGTVGTTARASATCPKGMAAISGGWQTRTPGGGAFRVNESLRQGKRTWTVEGQVVIGAAPGQSQTLIATAACQAGAAPSSVREFIQAPVGGGTALASNGASCPRGRTAISGGFVTELPQGGAVTGSFRVRRAGWEVEATVPASSPAALVPLRTVVYCVKGDGDGVRSVAHSYTVNGQLDEGIETRNCPYLAGSAGFRLISPEPPDPGEERLLADLYFASFKHAGTRLRVAGDQQLTEKVFAYCVRR